MASNGKGKRLAKEYQSIKTKADPRFVVAENSKNYWVVKLVTTANETDALGCPCYSGGHYKVVITFPDNYPHEPPAMKFDPPVYHPCINQTTGDAGFDLHHNVDWNATKNIQFILDGLFNMLTSGGTSEGSHLLEPDIQREMTENRTEFDDKVKAQVREFFQSS